MTRWVASDLAGHRVGGAPDEHVAEARRVDERLGLVHVPDEAGAVEAAGNDVTERRLLRGRAASPHVWVADKPHAAGEYLALQLSELGKRERPGRVA